MTHQTPPAEVYASRVEQFAASAKSLAQRSDRLSNIRLLAVIIAIACAGAGAYWHETTALLVLSQIGALGGAGAFVGLVATHARVTSEEEHAHGLHRINREAEARLARNWHQLSMPGEPSPIRDNALAVDLDLFGHGSLYHLIGTVGTPQGRHTLTDWLVTPPRGGPDAILQRQAAVVELAPELDLRQDLEHLAAEFKQTPSGQDSFLTWASGESWLRQRPHLAWATRLVPVLLFTSLILTLFGYVDFRVPLALVVLRQLVAWRGGGEIQRRLEFVCARQKLLTSYADLFQRLSRWGPRSPLLQEIQEHLRGADAEMAGLQTIVNLAAIRTTPANPFVQLLLMWDWHTLWLMEGWQERNGTRVRTWFEALGEVEALAALSVLRFEEPAWCFPKFTQELTVSGRALGHPLLPAASRVANDVTLGPPGTCLLVTGSNMSGKSTLLRTVGINALLARAGAPVCAEEFTLPLELYLATSLRVQDSLQEGVSFFMAELRRLAGIVKFANEIDAQPDGPVVLYLLDEILRGTNTHERQIIVGKVIGHLLKRRTIGAITTHDLSLAETEGIADAFRAVHFMEEFEEGPDGATMRFDYRMRPGLATTTNALKLVKVIGLEL